MTQSRKNSRNARAKTHSLFTNVAAHRSLTKGFEPQWNQRSQSLYRTHSRLDSTTTAHQQRAEGTTVISLKQASVPHQNSQAQKKTTLVGLFEDGIKPGQHGYSTLKTVQQDNPNALIVLVDRMGAGKFAESLNQFVDYAIREKHTHVVINLSLDLAQQNPDGSITTRHEFTAPERGALARALEQGFLVVASAGNNSGLMSALGRASGRSDNLIVVGAAEKGHRAKYSSHGTGLDMLVPVKAGAGTSQAAAEMSNTIAKLWENHPDLTPRQIMAIVSKASEDIGLPGPDSDSGLGIFNADIAFQLACETKPEPMSISNTYFRNQTYASANNSNRLGRATWLDNRGARAIERPNWNLRKAVEKAKRAVQKSPVATAARRVKRAVQKSPVATAARRIKRATRKSPIATAVRRVKRATRKSPIAAAVRTVKRAVQRFPIATVSRTVKQAPQGSPVATLAHTLFDGIRSFRPNGLERDTLEGSSFMFMEPSIMGPTGGQPDPLDVYPYGPQMGENQQRSSNPKGRANAFVGGLGDMSEEERQQAIANEMADAYITSGNNNDNYAYFDELRKRLPPRQRPSDPSSRSRWEGFSPIVHGILQAFGLVPGVGALPDLADAALYTVEGKEQEALFSVLSAVVGVGDVARVMKWLKQGRAVTEVASDASKNLPGPHPTQVPPSAQRRRPNPPPNPSPHNPLARPLPPQPHPVNPSRGANPVVGSPRTNIHGGGPRRNEVLAEVGGGRPSAGPQRSASPNPGDGNPKPPTQTNSSGGGTSSLDGLPTGRPSPGRIRPSQEALPNPSRIQPELPRPPIRAELPRPPIRPELPRPPLQITARPPRPGIRSSQPRLGTSSGLIPRIIEVDSNGIASFIGTSSGLKLQSVARPPRLSIFDRVRLPVYNAFYRAFGGSRFWKKFSKKRPRTAAGIDAALEMISNGAGQVGDALGGPLEGSIKAVGYGAKALRFFLKPELPKK